MTHKPFENPLLGIFVQNAGQDTEHCFGALFDRASDGRILDYQLLSYTGTPRPPSTERSDEVVITDGGVLLPISKTAASQLIAQLDTVREELTADPKLQRYYYSKRVKLPNSIQASHGRIPTNCVDYLMQAAQNAGIDVGAISDTWRDADRVEDIGDTIDKATPASTSHCVHVDAILFGTTPMYYTLNPIERRTEAVFFRSDKTVDMLEAVNCLPREMLKQASETKPLGEPLSKISTLTHTKAIAPSTALASDREL